MHPASILFCANDRASWMVQALALSGDASAVQLPRPLARRADCHFSFSGLKTAVKAALLAHGGGVGDAGGSGVCDGPLVPDRHRADIAAAFQHNAIEHLADKTRRAMAWFDSAERARRGPLSPVAKPTLVVCGGVAANRALRSRLSALCARTQWDLLVPPAELCTDNGVMVAWAAVEGLAHARPAPAPLVRPRWPLGPMVRVGEPSAASDVGAGSGGSCRVRTKAESPQLRKLRAFESLSGGQGSGAGPG